MLIQVLKSKLQSVVVTEANIAYKGSITLDPELMEAARLRKNEAVHVNNATNGARIITYVIPGRRGSGEVCLNGAAALHFSKNDVVHILAYAHLSEEELEIFEPSVVYTNAENRILEKAIL